MDGKRSWKKTDEAEIDLIDLLQKLCMHWKQIAACALVFAVLAGGYGFLRNRSSEKTAVDIMKEEKELTEEEQQAVGDAVQLAKEADRLEEYMKNSILMQIDPYHKTKVVCLYSIEKASNEELLKITESYLNYLINGGAAEALKRADSRTWNIDAGYLSEAITAWQKTDSTYKLLTNEGQYDSLAGTVLYVETVGKNEKAAKQMAEGIQDALKEHSSDVNKKCGKHVLSLLQSETSTIVDTALQTQQYDKRELLKSYRSNLESLKDTLSEEQKAVYEKESGKQGETEEDTGTEAADSGFSVKYLLLGCLAGIFLYCAGFAVWYLLQDTIKSAAEFQSCYSLPFYGRISMRQGKKKQDVQEAEKQRILRRVRLACKKRGIIRLCLASDFAAAQSERLCLESMADKLREWEIDTVFAEDINRKAELWDTASDMGTVLMICRIGSTTHKMVDEEMAFYQENGITVLGAALLESV